MRFGVRKATRRSYRMGREIGGGGRQEWLSNGVVLMREYGEMEQNLVIPTREEQPRVCEGGWAEKREWQQFSFV